MGVGSFLRSLGRLEPAAGSDAELLAAFVAARDERAFAALVARHGPMVLGVCRRALGRTPDAEDAFQATFLVLARRAGSLRQPAALAGWLYGVAQRVARRSRDSARRPGGTPVDPVDRGPDPLAALSARDLLDALEVELSRLPRAYQLPVILCCLQGLSQEEAAARLGWSAGSVRGRLERGRRRLRERLSKRGLDLGAVLGAATMAGGPVMARRAAALAELAVRFVDGRLSAGISSQVLSLSEGVLQAMSLTKFRLAVFAALVCLVGAAGVGLSQRTPTPPAVPAPPPVDKPAEKRAKPFSNDGTPGPNQSAEAERMEPQKRQLNFLRDSLNTRLPLDKPIESRLKDVIDYLEDVASPPESARDTSLRVKIRADDRAFRTAFGKDFDVLAETMRLPQLTGAPLEVALGFLCEQLDAVFVLRTEYIELTTPEQALGRPLRRGESRTLVHEQDGTPWPADWTLQRLARRYNRTVIIAAGAREKAKARLSAELRRLSFETAVATVAEAASLRVVGKDNALLVTTAEHAGELAGGRTMPAPATTRSEEDSTTILLRTEADPDQIEYAAIPRWRKSRHDTLLRLLHSPLTLEVAQNDRLKEMTYYLERAASPPESARDPTRAVRIIADHLAFQAAKGTDFKVEDVTVRLPPMKDAPLEAALATLTEQVNGVLRVCPDFIEITTPEAALGRPLRRGESRVLANYRAEDWPVDWSLTWLERRYHRVVSLSPQARQAAKGRASVYLVNVPFETAVEMVAEAGGLKAVRQGNALLVTTPEDARGLIAARKAEDLGAWEIVPSKDEPVKP